MLSYLARRWWPAFVTLAVAIGLSRVNVGDHYPGDVLAGAALGSLVGLAAWGVVAVARLRVGPRAHGLRLADGGSGRRSPAT